MRFKAGPSFTQHPVTQALLGSTFLLSLLDKLLKAEFKVLATNLALRFDAKFKVTMAFAALFLRMKLSTGATFRTV